MRIAHYIHDLGGRGGIETYVDRLGTALAARGHEVLYLGLRGPVAADRLLIPSVDDLYAEARRLDVDVLHLHKAVPARPPSSLAVVRTVHDNGAACPSGSRYLQRTQQPCPRIASLPACLFGHYVDGCGSRRPASVLQNFRRMANNRAVLPDLPTLTVSQHLKDEMIRAGYPADTIRVMPSPAPTGPSTPPPLQLDAPPRLLFLGRLVPEKGLSWLLRALPHLPANVHLDVAGDGYAQESLSTLSERLGLSARVHFHGWVPPEDTTSLFLRARAVVVPSVWHEPAGLVPLEAAAYARPVVASTVGGLPEYAHPDFSLHVAPHDEAGLAVALHRLTSDAPFAAELGRAGHTRVRSHCTLSSFVDQHEALYTSLTRDYSYHDVS